MKQDFERRLQASGTGLGALTPSAGVRAMLAFYREAPGQVATAGVDSDMLLYQWGTYDRGGGRHFEFDITRQLIVEPGGDDDIWQLSLTFRLSPDATLEALGSGNRWCSSSADLATFEPFVRTHPASAAVGSRSDAEVNLHLEQAG